MTSDGEGDLSRLVAENAQLRAQLAATQHRVRNTLAVIRSIARRSAETSESVEEYAAHLDGRIEAFGRVQGSLLNDAGSGMRLDSLVSNVLLSVLAAEGKRWTLGGPDVILKGKTAELLGLALHELATNAIKFGALFWPAGRLGIAWWLSQEEGTTERRLSLSWRETGAPEPTQALRRGFGTEVIEQTLAYELGARSSLTFGAAGVSCTISLPMSAIHSPSGG